MQPSIRWGRAIALACALSLGALTGRRAARADLLDDIMAAKKIRIATDLAIPPSGMIDDQMKPTGSDVETAQLLAKDWGLELEFVQTTGATRIPNVQTGKADIIISTLSVTPERAKVIDFSQALCRAAIGDRRPGGRARSRTGRTCRARSVTVTRGTTQDTELTKLAAEKGFQVRALRRRRDHGDRRRLRPGRDRRHLGDAGEPDQGRRPRTAPSSRNS